MGLATLAAGPLYDRFGTFGYLVMTALAIVGMIAGWRLKGCVGVS
jgi:PPP family 3-phenylpropionic acid transporter